MEVVFLSGYCEEVPKYPPESIKYAHNAEAIPPGQRHVKGNGGPKMVCTIINLIPHTKNSNPHVKETTSQVTTGHSVSSATANWWSRRHVGSALHVSD